MRTPPTLKRPFAPLIWSVIGIVLGYALAESFPEAVGSIAGAVVAWVIFGVAVALGIWQKKAWRKVAVVMGVGALASLYYHSVDSRQASVEEAVPAMEAQVEVKIKQRFALRAESGRVSGLGEIVSVSPDIGAVENANVYFSARWEIDDPMNRESVVRFHGILEPAEENAAVGFEGYLNKRHVQWKLTRAQAVEIAKPAPWIMQGIEGIRRWSIDVLSRGWGQPSNGLLSAMVVGAKAEISKQQKENFIRSGTMHLLAISGLNVMVVAGGLALLGKLFGLRGAALALVVAAATWLYAQVAGAAPSVMRAWGMVMIAAVGFTMRRQVNVWSVLVLAAVVSLILEPLSLWHAGWRLSFGVVAGMVLGMSTWERLVPMERLPGWSANIVRALVVSIVAGISVAPMTAVYFGLAQPWGWVLNSVSVLIASGVTLLGMASLLTGWLAWMPESFNAVANGLLWGLEKSIELYLKAPAAVLDVKVATWVESVGTVAILLTFYLLARYTKKREFF